MTRLQSGFSSSLLWPAYSCPFSSLGHFCSHVQGIFMQSGPGLTMAHTTGSTGEVGIILGIAASCTAETWSDCYQKIEYGLRYSFFAACGIHRR
jgi:hypothetical protein